MPKPEEKDWTPDQPLDDEDDEAECQRKARATARVNHLVGGFDKPAKGKKKGIWD